MTRLRLSRTRGGDPERYFRPRYPGAVYPAHAGVILSPSGSKIWKFSLSRTRGGDPDLTNSQREALRFIPHTRG